MTQDPFERRLQQMTGSVCLETLGVIKNGNERGRDAEDPDLVQARHFIGKGGASGYFGGSMHKTFFASARSRTACARGHRQAGDRHQISCVVIDRQQEPINFAPGFFV